MPIHQKKAAINFMTKKLLYRVSSSFPTVKMDRGQTDLLGFSIKIWKR